jgi:2-C-methyl-D-erythritol 4-phosphate cytidylyltransferase
MSNAVIIVAGGIGNRMGSDIPKQFLMLENEPILMHTMRRFIDFDSKIKIIVVLPQKQIAFWKSLCDEYQFTIPHEMVHGGTSRFHSVKNGLSKITGPSVVGIHDGVRPFVSAETIRSCYQVAEKKGNAIPVVPVNETVRMVSDNQSQIVDRNKLWMVQTPQVFQSEIILKSFEQKYSDSFTDDANVVEAAGHHINLVDGNRENIKITTKTDLIIAEAFIKGP